MELVVLEGSTTPVTEATEQVVTQKYVFDRLASQKPELQEQYKAGNRDAKKKLINNLIPHEAGHNVRIDPASVECVCVISKMVTAKRLKGHKGIEEGKTLTERWRPHGARSAWSWGSRGATS